MDYLTGFCSLPPYRWAANRPQPGRIRTDLNIASPWLHHLLENHRQLFGFSCHGSPHCQNTRVDGWPRKLDHNPAEKALDAAFGDFVHSTYGGKRF